MRQRWTCSGGPHDPNRYSGNAAGRFLITSGKQQRKARNHHALAMMLTPSGSSASFGNEVE